MITLAYVVSDRATGDREKRVQAARTNDKRKQCSLIYCIFKLRASLVDDRTSGEHEYGG